MARSTSNVGKATSLSLLTVPSHPCKITPALSSKVYFNPLSYLGSFWIHWLCEAINNARIKTRYVLVTLCNQMDARSSLELSEKMHQHARTFSKKNCLQVFWYFQMETLISSFIDLIRKRLSEWVYFFFLVNSYNVYSYLKDLYLNDKGLE